MKKLVLLLLLVAVACGGGEREIEGLTPLKEYVPPTATPDRAFVIQIRGTKGLEFQGTIGGINEDGQYVSRSVDGRIPEEYRFEGLSVSCVFQKMERSGTLGVRIFRAGKPLGAEATTAEFGVVSLAVD